MREREGVTVCVCVCVRERERERERERKKRVGLCLVEVAEIAIGRSSPSKLYSGTVSSHTHSLIDEVECAAFRIICHLKIRVLDSHVVMFISGHYS